MKRSTARASTSSRLSPRVGLLSDCRRSHKSSTDCTHSLMLTTVIVTTYHDVIIALATGSVAIMFNSSSEKDDVHAAHPPWPIDNSKCMRRRRRSVRPVRPATHKLTRTGCGCTTTESWKITATPNSPPPRPGQPCTICRGACIAQAIARWCMVCHHLLQPQCQ